MSFKTEQENFWAGDFGDQYISRNDSEKLIAGNIHLFAQALKRTSKIDSIIEFGANIGNNLKSLRNLLPECELSAVEINKNAAAVLQAANYKTYNESIVDFAIDYKRDLVFTKGVLIHISPDILHDVYKNIYAASNKYILLMEYYNRSPVSITYRGHENRLFKRDFAGDMLDIYSDLELIDYGFAYYRDTNIFQDDISWFLLKKI